MHNSSPGSRGRTTARGSEVARVLHPGGVDHAGEASAGGVQAHRGHVVLGNRTGNHVELVPRLGLVQWRVNATPWDHLGNAVTQLLDRFLTHLDAFLHAEEVRLLHIFVEDQC